MPKIGSPRRANLSRNCLICTKWVGCRDPDKAGNYACSRFRESEEGADALMELFEQQNAPANPKDIEERISAANDEQSISDIIEEVITSGIPVPPDLRINDRHIIKPNNVFEWMTDSRFIGGEQVPFAKQVEVAVHMMGEWCPTCSDADYFEDIPVDDTMDDIQERVVFLRKGICPECSATKSDLVAEELLLDPTQMVGIAGQRSSKSATFHMIESYNTARLLCTPSLPKIFSILPSTPLISTYTALTYGQARRNLWDPLYAIFTDSTWFSEYNAFIKTEGYRLSEELIVLNDTSLRYRHKNMWLAAAPPSKRTLRGATRFSAAVDELGWFPVGNTKSGKDFERLDAKEVHKALLNSLRTMKSAYNKRLRAGYSNIPKPMMINISSPSSVNDMIMTLYRQQKNSRETYSFLYKTWDFNPLLPESEFADEFRTNPVEAARDYACEPPLGANAYFTDKEVLMNACSGGKNAIRVTSNRFATKSGKLLMTGNYKLQRRTESNYSGILAIDAGYIKDCLAGETRVITKNGTRAIKNLKGRVEILNAKSEWVYGDFSYIGKRKLYNITLKLNQKEKTIRATGTHRWFIEKYCKKIETTTDKLEVGQQFAYAMPPKVDYVEIDPIGVENGVVFGDGYKHGRTRQAPKHSAALLTGHKIKFLLPYFKAYKKRGKYWGYSGSGKSRAIIVRNLPIHYKNIPRITETNEYLLGFIAGYLATDGCVDKKGSVMLNAIHKKDLNKVRSIANKLGIATSPISKQESINYFNGKPFTVYKIFFLRQTFPSNLLLNPEHRKRFENDKKNRGISRWTITAIEETDDVEAVYCATVPGTHDFVLEDYIVTGNSFAFAVAYPVSLPTKMMGDEVDEDDEVSNVTKVRIHAVGEVIAKPGVPVSFNSIYKNILLPFINEFNIGAIISDRWQNIKILQDIEDAEGTACFEHRLTKTEFDDYREALFDKNVILPKPEMELEDIVNTTLDNYPHCFYLKPVSHLIYQHLTVVSTGSTVIKGEATDDMFRTCVLAYAGLQMESVLEEITSVYEDDVINGALGAIATAGSVSGSAGSKPMAGIGSKFSLGGTMQGGSNSGSLGSVHKRR